MKWLSKEIIFQSDQLSQDLSRKSVRGAMPPMTAQGIRFVLALHPDVRPIEDIVDQAAGCCSEVTSTTANRAQVSSAS